MKEDSLAGKAYSELRKKILSNQLASGARLKEDFWAKRLEVNRMAIREALTRLLGEKLLEQGEKGGFFVKTLTEKDIQEIKELREILELGAVRLAIHHIDETYIKKLEGICHDFTAMVQGGYLGGACEADIKFHEVLIECSGNEKLSELYQASNIPLFHQKLGQAQAMDDYELTEAEHLQILNGLKKRDLALVEEALLTHLQRGKNAVLDLS